MATEQLRFECERRGTPTISPADVAFLESAEARARARMQRPAAHNPTRAEIEADLRKAADDFARNHV